MISYLFLIPPAERATVPQARRLPSCFDPRLAVMWTTFMQSAEISATLKRLNTLVEKWGFLLRTFIHYTRSQGVYAFRHEGSNADLDAVRSHLYRQRKTILKLLKHRNWMKSLVPVPFSHRCDLSIKGDKLLLHASIRLRLPDTMSFTDLSRYAKHTLRFSGSPVNLVKRSFEVNFNLKRVADNVASLSYRVILPSVSPAAFGKDIRTEADLTKAVFESV
jgi:hypothetical protein